MRIQPSLWKLIVLFCCAIGVFPVAPVSIDSAIAAEVNSRLEKSLGLYRIMRTELHADFSKSLTEIEDFCEKKGFDNAVARLREITKPGVFEDPRFDKLPKSVQQDLPADLSPDERFWQAQLRFEQSKYAKELYLLSRRALHAGLPSFAYDLVRELAYHDSDHKSARRILGYVRYGDEWVTPVAAAMLRKRQVWHDDFGWLPHLHVARYEQGERYFNRRWISAAKEAELRRDFRNAWEIRTDHYLVKTNHSLERGVELGRALERFHAFFHKQFAPFFSTPEQMRRMFEGAHNGGRSTGNEKPYVVHYYRTREEYIERLRSKVPVVAITNGLYWTGDRVAHFYNNPDADWKTTVFHEATHQLFYESQSRERRIAERAHFWIIEGIACYMESFEWKPGRPVIGDPDFIRFANARYRLLVDQYYLPMVQFTNMGMQDFQTHANIAKNYSQASGLAHFFMHYDDGLYRDALIEHLSQLYAETRRLVPKVNSLAELTDTPFSELDRKYAAYLRDQENAIAREVNSP